MRNALALFILTLVVASTAFSQNLRFLPDPNAVLLTTMTLDIGFEADPNGTPTEKKDAKDVITVLIGQWRNSDGNIEYQIEARTVRFSGYGPTVDAALTAPLFNMIANVTIREGIQRGMIPTPPCDLTAYTTRVHASRCVDRMGAGTDTRFEPCDETTYATWAYSICGSNTSPSIVRTPYYVPNTCDASRGCELTCTTQQQSGGVIQ